jgi:four helix bundle protein
MTAEKIENNPIVKHTFEFALLVNEYAVRLRELKHWDLASQLFRSGTAIGANVWEAQNNESRADFLHKMKIGAKEANEALYWLMLCAKSAQYPDCKALLSKLETGHKILNAIISTAKKESQEAEGFSRK